MSVSTSLRTQFTGVRAPQQPPRHPFLSHPSAPRSGSLSLSLSPSGNGSSSSSSSSSSGGVRQGQSRTVEAVLTPRLRMNQIQTAPVVKVVDGIFVGSYVSAYDAQFLTRNKIALVINCAGNEVPNVFEGRGGGIRYVTLNLPSGDSAVLTAPLLRMLTAEVFRTAVVQHECVLVHSMRGRGRAFLVVIAVLARLLHWHPSGVREYVSAVTGARVPIVDEGCLLRSGLHDTPSAPLSDVLRQGWDEVWPRIEAVTRESHAESGGKGESSSAGVDGDVAVEAMAGLLAVLRNTYANKTGAATPLTPHTPGTPCTPGTPATPETPTAARSGRPRTVQFSGRITTHTYDRRSASDPSLLRSLLPPAKSTSTPSSSSSTPLGTTPSSLASAPLGGSTPSSSGRRLRRSRGERGERGERGGEASSESSTSTTSEEGEAADGESAGERKQRIRRMRKWADGYRALEQRVHQQRRRNLSTSLTSSGRPRPSTSAGSTTPSTPLGTPSSTPLLRVGASGHWASAGPAMAAVGRSPGSGPAVRIRLAKARMSTLLSPTAGGSGPSTGSTGSATGSYASSGGGGGVGSPGVASVRSMLAASSVRTPRSSAHTNPSPPAPAPSTIDPTPTDLGTSAHFLTSLSAPSTSSSSPPSSRSSMLYVLRRTRHANGPSSPAYTPSPPHSTPATPSTTPSATPPAATAGIGRTRRVKLYINVSAATAAPEVPQTPSPDQRSPNTAHRRRVAAPSAARSPLEGFAASASPTTTSTPLPPL